MEKQLSFQVLLEHIERAGVHSGDSIAVYIRLQTLSQEDIDTLEVILSN